MPRYSIEITVSASRQEDTPPEQEISFRPGEDPMKAQAQLIEMAARSFRPVRTFPFRSGSLSMNKTITVTAESFDALAGILSAFDHIAETIECQNPSA